MKDHIGFNKSYKDIYLSQIELKKESISTSEASFLNLSIIIQNRKIKFQLLDKRAEMHSPFL